jgi:hypothetical protein
MSEYRTFGLWLDDDRYAELVCRIVNRVAATRWEPGSYEHEPVSLVIDGEFQPIDLREGGMLVSALILASDDANCVPGDVDLDEELYL